jgi:putrescine:ornithine antiporter
MFNPTIGSIIMALAVVACLGSLLGWQFTIAQTEVGGRPARCFPVFGVVNRLGAPVAGMIIMGVAQSVLALTTISPSLSEQFGVLVNLAVVPGSSIISLSALPVMLQAAGVASRAYRDHRRRVGGARL